jgi:DNA-binding CsgD family transcriptional regulator
MPRTFVLRCCTAPFLRFAIGTGSYTLGRSNRCHVVVDHPSISRRHAVCCVDQDGLIVADLGSRNGTFIDNLRVERSRVARDQTVRFGDLSFSIATNVGPLSPDDEEETDLGKSDEKPVTANAAQATVQLSAAQRRVFEHLLGGKKEKRIAKMLQRSPHTIHAHVRAIFRLFAVHSRLELLARFVDLGPQ